jgi:predicted small lipoprotein YifL
MRFVPVIVAVVALTGCGPGGPKDPSLLLAPPDAAAPVAVIPTSTALEGARLPPPLQLGSKHAERKPQTPSDACRAAARGPVTDAARGLDAVVRACAGGLKPAAVLSGSQDPTATAQSAPVKLEKGKCYRVAAAVGTGVKGLVVELVDADGAVAAEYHTDDVLPAVAPSESVCFKGDQAGRVTASVGAGSGPFAVQVLVE